MRALRVAAAMALVVTACSGGAGPSSVPTASTGTGPPPTAPSPTVAEAPATTVTVPPTTTSTTVPLEDLRLALEPVLEGFEQPVLLLPYPGAGASDLDVAEGAIVVVDQPGRLWLVDGADPEVFLDIRDQVRFGGEQGMLGLAFAPGFPTDPRLFVDFIDRSGDTRIVEYEIAEGGRQVAPGSARTVLTVPQPAGNHNGGMIAFGPDGMLWIGMGDGGGADDRFGNGQDPTTLLGAMVRIDVGPEAPRPYGIPGDNPFVAGGGAPEVWAIGLRNPWRWAFDGTDLWVADVGQDAVEEIDLVPDVLEVEGPVNLGWPIWEGDRCFAGPCDVAEGIVMPLVTYGHDAGCSITGGFVYRGADLPELDGRYFYGDFCSGRVWSVSSSGEVHEWTESLGRVEGLSSFGYDADGELYLVTVEGTIYRLGRRG